jgi:hypothetical protein
MAKKRRSSRKSTHKKSKGRRGGSFKSVLGHIGQTLLSVAPIVLSALGRKKIKRRGRGVISGSAYPIA